MGCVDGFTAMEGVGEEQLYLATPGPEEPPAPQPARSPVVVRPAQPSDCGGLGKKRDTSGSKVGLSQESCVQCCSLYCAAEAMVKYAQMRAALSNQNHSNAH